MNSFVSLRKKRSMLNRMKNGIFRTSTLNLYSQSSLNLWRNQCTYFFSGTNEEQKRNKSLVDALFLFEWRDRKEFDKKRRINQSMRNFLFELHWTNGFAFSQQRKVNFVDEMIKIIDKNENESNKYRRFTACMTLSTKTYLNVS